MEPLALALLNRHEQLTMSPKRTIHDAGAGDAEERDRKRAAGRGIQIEAASNAAFSGRPSTYSSSAMVRPSSNSTSPRETMMRSSSDPPGVSAGETDPLVAMMPAMYSTTNPFDNRLGLGNMAGLPLGVDPRSFNYRNSTHLARQALLEPLLEQALFGPGGSSFASSFPSLQNAVAANSAHNAFGLGALTGAQQTLQWHSGGRAPPSFSSNAFLASLGQSQPSPRAALPGGAGQPSDRFASNPTVATNSETSSASAPPPSPRLGTTTCRDSIPLAIDEDPNWLSAFHCFVRTHFLEICWASREDVAIRNSSKKVLLDQVGLRCKFCVSLPPSSRSPRSAAFPSSVKQIYQSFTMMLRDHFELCHAIPDSLKQEFLELKNTPCQGATEAKNYWAFAGKKLGMVDTDEGIIMNDASREAPLTMHNFGYHLDESALTNTELAGQAFPLAVMEDSKYVSEYYITLLSHYQRIRLLPSERKGNRKTMKAGLPGLGCRYCCKVRRFGLSRVFPARRRALPDRVQDLYDHICRCNLCPQESKDELKRLRVMELQNPGHQKAFFDVVWERLGHDTAEK